MSSVPAKSGDVLSPASAAKRKSIVRAAARVFMGAGYGAASMDLIAAEAGVSKQTVYSHFGAKDALFEEIVSGKCEELLDAEGLRVTDDGDPDVVLFEMAKVFLYVVLNDESVTLYRTILAECGRFPELAEVFYRAGPKTATMRLAKYLERVHGRGRLAVPDPEAAASMFFAMLRGNMYLQRILGLRGMPDDQEIHEKARGVAETFLRAYKA
ncbi:MAG: TetR/AcrR family transcriptional regulator [Rhodospirillales bacterium]|nr:TetR/AcrR family transcriptional regulator [Rhodospirillales bacterium]